MRFELLADTDSILNMADENTGPFLHLGINYCEANKRLLLYRVEHCSAPADQCLVPFFIIGNEDVFSREKYMLKRVKT